MLGETTCIHCKFAETDIMLVNIVYCDFMWVKNMIKSHGMDMENGGTLTTVKHKECHQYNELWIKQKLPETLYKVGYSHSDPLPYIQKTINLTPSSNSTQVN